MREADTAHKHAVAETGNRNAEVGGNRARDLREAGRVLRRMRVVLGWSQSRLGMEIGTHRATIGLLERGQHIAGPRTLRRIHEWNARVAHYLAWAGYHDETIGSLFKCWRLARGWGRQEVELWIRREKWAELEAAVDVVRPELLALAEVVVPPAVIREAWRRNQWRPRVGRFEWMAPGQFFDERRAA